jgi:hypothetical protein
VDEIFAISDPYNPVFDECDLLSSLTTIVAWFDATWPIAHADGQPRNQAYWRTLIGNTTVGEQRPATQDYETLYKGYVKLLRHCLKHYQQALEPQVTRYKDPGVLSPVLGDVLNLQVTPFAIALRKAAGH